MRNLNTKGLLTLIVLVLLYWPMVASGQLRHSFDTQEWLYGKVFLETGDSLAGGLMYHPEQDVVQIASADGVISTFSPVNVTHFVVVGVYQGRPQLFRSLPWNLGKRDEEFKKPVFFEQINSGTLVLMKRYLGIPQSRADNQKKEPYPNIFYPHIVGETDDLMTAYYVLLPDGEILPLRKRRKELNMLFGDKADQVKKYVRANKLDYEIPHHLVAIVDYFNSLHATAADGDASLLKVAETKE